MKIIVRNPKAVKLETVKLKRINRGIYHAEISCGDKYYEASYATLWQSSADYPDEKELVLEREGHRCAVSLVAESRTDRIIIGGVWYQGCTRYETDWLIITEEARRPVMIAGWKKKASAVDASI